MYRSPQYRAISLHCDGWTMGGVRVLTTPFERYVGIGSDGGWPVMLLTRSIHTFTMSRPISIIVVDLDGSVLRSGVMAPRRILWFGRKRWVVEANAEAPLPAPDSEIVASTMTSRCPEH
jgi:hypothetical protein